MIILGVILLIFGAILYHNGVVINNDMDAQIESVLNDGIKNPGSTYETVGILLLLSGVILIIVGIILRVNENRDEMDIPIKRKPEPPSVHTEPLSSKKVCGYCGALLSMNSNFCPNCGLENSNFMTCPSCAQRIASDSLFCDFCGADLLLLKFSLQNASEEDIISAAFDCIKSGDFVNSKALLDRVEKMDSKNVQVSLGRLLTEYKLHSVEELADVKEDFGKNIYYYNIIWGDDEALKEQVNLYQKYSQACLFMERKKYERSLQLFDEIGAWRDSKERAEYCTKKIEEQKRKAEEERMQELKVAKKKELMVVLIITIAVAVWILMILLDILS